jgi:hypothetical protein
MGDHWLMSALGKIDDAETRVSKTDATGCIYADVVRPTMPNHFGHATNCGCINVPIGEFNYSANSTHTPLFPYPVKGHAQAN